MKSNLETPIQAVWLPRLVFLLLLCSSALALARDPAVSELVDKLDRVRHDNGVAAFGLVLVDERGIAHLETRGLANLEHGIRIQNDAIFRIGSITKMFTGLAALQLDATSGFDLDAPIAGRDMASYYSNPWQQTRPLTTAMLLEHTAGLTDMAQPEWDYNDSHRPPLDETLRLYPGASLVKWPPGIHASYSNAGAGLAGRAMELASGRSYEALVENLVFQPLGLSDTSLFPPGARLPVGYDTDGVTPIPYWHQIFRPFAAINSSLQDMGRFIVMLINRGRLDDKSVFPPRFIDRLETPHTSLASRNGLRYGYGLGNYSWLREGILFHGHGGDADGSLSRLGYTRSNGRGYFLVITAFQGRTLRAMQRRVEEFIVAGLEAADPPPIHPLLPAELRRSTGRYEQQTWRFPGEQRQGIDIVEREGRLYTRFGEMEEALLPVTPVLFRRPRDNRATVFLGPADNGEIYYQDDRANYVRRSRSGINVLSPE